MIGSDRADLLTGSDANNTLVGGDGDGRMDGKLGNDVLRGGLGADTVLGSNGDDVLSGGDGADLIRGGFQDKIADWEDGLDLLKLDGFVFTDLTVLDLRPGKVLIEYGSDAVKVQDGLGLLSAADFTAADVV